MTARTLRRRVLLVLALILAAYAVRVALWRPLKVAGPAPNDGYTRVPGVVHVHTTHSDGGGTTDEVIAAARSTGLEFLVITDHNNLDAKPVEGYESGLLVLVGTEISTNGGHVLGLGIPDPQYRFSGDVQDALADIRDAGGVAFAAHPVSPRADFQWTGWDQPGSWGLELLNGDSQWRNAGWPRLLRTAVLYGINRRYSLLTSLTPPTETLARWDALLRERAVAGIVGADAHSRVPIRKETAVRFPSYEALFGLARNHVLLDAPLTGVAQRDAQALLGALAKGRSYVGVDALAPAGGFSFVAEAAGRRWTMGDTVAPAAGLTLRAGGALPAGAMVHLIRDGQRVSEGQGAVVLENVGPGVYRTEVHLPGWELPWVLSNPIYVFEEASAARREERAVASGELAPPTPAAMLDAFEGTTAWTPGSDSTSLVNKPILDPTGGEDGKGATRLSFRLGVPSAAQPHTFCALVDWTHRDLTGRTGLVFKIRADGEYRIWVQVRDENPASADDKTEWWFASVKTTTDWRPVTIPFARLRSINPKTDGRLDLDRVRALVFVLDRGAVKPGTEGTIWIDDVGVY
jgi:hypothetical protein